MDKGNTVTDYEPEEIERQISINSAVCLVEADDRKVNLVDTPGYSNFLSDTRAALRAVDGAAVFVSAAAGVEVGTEKVWEMLNDGGLPRLFVVNKLDRENASFMRTVEEIRQFFGRQAVPVQIPIGEEKAFAGVVDLVRQKALVFEKDESGQFAEVEVPANLKAEAEKKREELVEMIAENDEKLMEKYLEAGALSPEEVEAGLKKAVLDRQLFPVFAVSALSNIGVQPLVRGFIGLLPSPVERGEVKATVKGADGRGQAVRRRAVRRRWSSKPSPTRTPAASPCSGCSRGKISPDSLVTNVNKDADEKLGGLFFLQGKEQVPAGQVRCGDIVRHGQAQGDVDRRLRCRPRGPRSVLSPSSSPSRRSPSPSSPRPRADEDRISQASHRIIEEDPTVRFERDPDSNQLLISGNGELHVRIITDKLKKRYNVDVDLKPPKISYKETIKGRADVQGRHKKQTGGRGQFGDVWIKMEPLLARQGFRVRGQDLRRGHSPELHPLGRERPDRCPEEGRPGRLPGRRFQGHPVRRLLPRRRLVGHRLQDRRPQGLQAGHESKPGPPSSNRS